MGLLERIQAARAPRSWPVGAGAVPPFEEFHGHDVAEYSPEEYGNYVVTSNEIFAAASLRARLMSSLNLQLFRGRGTARTEVLHGPAVELLGRVNPYWSPRRLERMDELSMCLWGQSFWAIEKDGAGLPQEIWWMKPSRVRPVPHETGYIKEFLYEPLHGGPVISFQPGSNVGDSEALPAIWEEPEEFAKALRQAKEATAAFSEAASAGDEDAIKAALRDVGAACRGCHDRFRKDDD